MIASAIGFIGFLVTSQLAQQLALLWLGIGGFLAVYFYERRTRHKLTVANGARLGWLCGIFGFTAITVLIAMMALALSDPEFLNTFRQYMATNGVPKGAVEQSIRAFQQPSGITSILFVSFLMFTLLPACGGAICAKLLSRD